MKVILTFLTSLLLLLTFPVTAHAQTLSPYQTRCGLSTTWSCSFTLYDANNVPHGTASLSFPRGTTPDQMPAGMYVADQYDGYPVSYPPINPSWTKQLIYNNGVLAHTRYLFDYTTMDGKKAHIEIEYIFQKYGCGKSACSGTFPTILTPTIFQQ